MMRWSAVLRQPTQRYPRDPGSTGNNGLMFSWRDADAARPNERFGRLILLVENGRGLAAVQPNEQVYSAIDWGRNPRTVIAKNVDGDSLLITVDGRTPGGAGLRRRRWLNGWPMSCR